MGVIRHLILLYLVAAQTYSVQSNDGDVLKSDIVELTLEKLIEKTLDERMHKREHSARHSEERVDKVLATRNLAECTDKKFDLVFVIDSSLSIGTANFNTMKTFVSSVVGQFDISSDNTRVGMTLFGSAASDVFYFNTHDSLQLVQDAINGATYTGGLTFLHEGIKSTQDNQFTSTNGDRDGIINIIIAVTDGRFSNNITANSEADNAKNNDIKIMSIGVGCAIDEDQIRDISSPPQVEGQDYFLTTDFQKLEQEVSSALATAICTIPDCGTLPPPEFGSISFTHTLANGKAIYSCDIGTGIMNGSPVRHCQADGTWSGQAPTCIDCLDKPMDIVFVVDGSGSVGSSNFQLMTDFINGVIGKLNIAPDKTRVGYVRFSNGAESIFNLNDHTSSSTLQTAVSGVTYNGGSTNMKAAIIEMRDAQFTATFGDRSNAVNVAVLLSDGKFKPDDQVQATLDEAVIAQGQGIQMISIGITNGVVESQVATADIWDEQNEQLKNSNVKGISSQPQQKGINYFLADNFQTLETQLIDALPHQVCQAWSEE